MRHPLISESTFKFSKHLQRLAYILLNWSCFLRREYYQKRKLQLVQDDIGRKTVSCEKKERKKTLESETDMPKFNEQAMKCLESEGPRGTSLSELI